VNRKYETNIASTSGGFAQHDALLNMKSSLNRDDFSMAAVVPSTVTGLPSGKV